MLDRLEIDDPMQIIQTHGACGLWGLLAVGIFENERGLIYAGQFNQFGIQIIGILAILTWTGFLTLCVFRMLKGLGKCRVGEILEIYGMDMLEDLEIKHQQQLSVDPNTPLDQNYAKLVKLEVKQRKQQELRNK